MIDGYARIPRLLTRSALLIGVRSALASTVGWRIRISRFNNKSGRCSSKHEDPPKIQHSSCLGRGLVREPDSVNLPVQFDFHNFFYMRKPASRVAWPSWLSDACLRHSGCLREGSSSPAYKPPLL